MPVYTSNGALDTAFLATGRTLAATQSHWFCIDGGQILKR